MSTMTILEGFVHCTPAAAGYCEDSLERIDSHFSGLIRKERIQCASYILSRNGRVFANRYMGPQTPDPGSPPFSPDSVRRLASVTKIFTAAAVMKLIEDGKLYLNQRISSVIKEFDTDQHRGITLVHLLTHTSGMVRPDGGSMCEPYPEWGFWGLEEEEDGKAKWFRSALSGPMLREPGTEWMYCSSGFMVLAEVVSRVSGMAYADFVTEKILEPLGMNSSRYFCSGEWELRRCRTRNENPPRFREPLRSESSFALGSNGLFSSQEDLWRFGQMLLNEGELDGVRILGPQTVRALRGNRLSGVTSKAWGNDRKDVKYGLGFDHFDGNGLVSPGTFGHEGAGRCRIVLDPAEGFAVIFFVPTEIDWVAESVQTPMALFWAGLE